MILYYSPASLKKFSSCLSCLFSSLAPTPGPFISSSLLTAPYLFILPPPVSALSESSTEGLGIKMKNYQQRVREMKKPLRWHVAHLDLLLSQTLTGDEWMQGVIRARIQLLTESVSLLQLHLNHAHLKKTLK